MLIMLAETSGKNRKENKEMMLSGFTLMCEINYQVALYY